MKTSAIAVTSAIQYGVQAFNNQEGAVEALAFQYTALGSKQKEMVIGQLARSGLTRSEAESTVSLASAYYALKSAESDELFVKEVSSKITRNKILLDIAQLQAAGDLNKEEVLSVLIKHGVNEETGEQIAENIVLTASNKAVEVSTKGVTKAMLAMIATNPVTWILALVAAVGIAITAINNYQQSVRDAAVESGQNYQSLVGEIDSLNSELATTQERMEELNAMDSLTLVEREELETLQKTNGELLEQLELKQRLAQIAAVQAEKDAIKALELPDNIISDRGSNQFYDDFSAAEIYLERVADYNRRIKDLREKQSYEPAGSKEWNRYEDRIAMLQKQSDKYQASYASLSKDIATSMENFIGATPEGVEYMDRWNSILHESLEVLEEANEVKASTPIFDPKATLLNRAPTVLKDYIEGFDDEVIRIAFQLEGFSIHDLDTWAAAFEEARKIAEMYENRRAGFKDNLERDLMNTRIDYEAWKDLTTRDTTDLIKDTDSAGYEYLSEQAEFYGTTVAWVCEQLEKLGYLQAKTTDPAKTDSGIDLTYLNELAKGKPATATRSVTAAVEAISAALKQQAQDGYVTQESLDGLTAANINYANAPQIRRKPSASVARGQAALMRMQHAPLSTKSRPNCTNTPACETRRFKSSSLCP